MYLSSLFYPQISDFLDVIWMLLILLLVLKVDFVEELAEIFLFDFLFSLLKWSFPQTGSLRRELLLFQMMTC